MKKPKLITIRGSPASGKSSLARNLSKELNGKIALLILDEFRWIMTAHEERDKKDFDISFDNFIYCLKNYLKLGYTVIVEDAWVRKDKDNATDMNKVLDIAKEYNASIKQILLKGSWNRIRYINTLRPMVIPEKELKTLYNKVYSKNFENEIEIKIDKKSKNSVLKEALKEIK